MMVVTASHATRWHMTRTRRSLLSVSAFIVIYMKHMLMQAAAELMLLVVHHMLGQCKCDAVPSFLMAASKCSLKLPPQFDFFLSSRFGLVS